MKLRRFFASFSIVLLLFSVSVPLCFANTIGTSGSEYALKLYVGLPGDDPMFDNDPILIPSSSSGMLRQTTDATFGYTPFYFESGLFEPKDYDRTVYFTVGISTLGSTDLSGLGGSAPILSYTRPEENTIYSLANAVFYAGTANLYSDSHQSLYLMRIIIPAGANSIKFNTEGWVGWNNQAVNGKSAFTIQSEGAYIIDTADDAVLNAIQQILQHTQSINNNTGTMVVAINQILSELRALNVDTDTIVSVLNALQGLSESQLVQLEKISTSVDAIYFFLTEALKSESEDASQAVQDTVNSIDNSHASEAFWQTSMQGNYDSLDLEHFSFGGITGGIELVGRIFTDMWSAFGEYQILFTFPLVLGIALLVIGRISKFGGGNSSRNKEHKGGEGGA